MKVPLPHLVTSFACVALLSLLPVPEEASRSENDLPDSHSCPTTSDRTVAATPAERRRGSSRELWKQPMVRVGLSIGYENRYADYISTLGLTEEELNYFCALLSKRYTESGIFDLKWAASPGELKESILEELESSLARSNALIRQFLNHDGDFQLFLDHEARLPDREALSQVSLVQDLDREDFARLLEELHQARTETQEATGCQFECWRFLAERRDLTLLQALREETDRKLEARLSEVFPPDKEHLFLAQWNAVRKKQDAESETTLGILLEKQS